MSTPRILVVIGTPLRDSLNHALAEAYVAAARDGGADVHVVDLAADPVPPHPESRAQVRLPRAEADAPLPDEVAGYIAELERADHVVVFFPQWWGTFPAALKSFIDRVFVSGFAFRYHDTGPLWDKLLTGRTARIVETMDSPGFWNGWVYRDAAIRALKKATLEYCGIRVRNVTRLTRVRHRSDAQRVAWLDDAAAMGRADAARTVARALEPVAA